jgi:phenylpyruvate tautomerase PptA (4-oxalocrotonate tautomerase family)
VVIQVFLARGRTEQMKRGLYAAVADSLAKVGVDRRNVFVTLVETGLDDWSFGEGQAQYLDRPPTHVPGAGAAEGVR